MNDKYNKGACDCGAEDCECGYECDSDSFHGCGCVGCNSVLVREFAPDFYAEAVMPNNEIVNNFNLYDYLGEDYGYVFFYPLDFTFVCPSEILAHNNRLEEFKKRHVKVIGISVDSVYSHLAWKKLPIMEGGIGELGFPLVSDISKEISKAFGVLNEDGVALRASFLLDKDGIVRHQIVNDIPLGRDVDETLRIIDALQSYEKNGNVCPAGWHPGDDVIIPTPEGVSEFLKKHGKKL